MLKISLCLAIAMCFVAQAASSEGFSERFKLKRDSQGELQSVHLLKYTKKFSLKPYINQVVNDLKEEVKRLSQKSSDKEISEFLDSLSEHSLESAELEENIDVVGRSLRSLRDLDVDGSFLAIRKSGVLSKFEDEFKKAIRMLDLSIMANPVDSQFYYKKKVTYEVVKRALDFAKKRFDSVPLLNLASFLIVKVNELILEQRIFSQNMLIYYLENFPADELGLSEKEVDLVMSSIYEAKIGVMNFLESKKAKENWANYGMDSFFTMLRFSKTRVKRSEYVKKFDYINFNYIQTFSEGQKVIVNTQANKHMFSAQMPIIHYVEQPEKVKRFRALLGFANIGLGFLPIPGWIKSNVQAFVESYYVEQRRTEGALIAHFESLNDKKMVKKIRAQVNNPYIVF